MADTPKKKASSKGIIEELNKRRGMPAAGKVSRPTPSARNTQDIRTRFSQVKGGGIGAAIGSRIPLIAGTTAATLLALKGLDEAAISGPARREEQDANIRAQQALAALSPEARALLGPRAMTDDELDQVLRRRQEAAQKGGIL